MKSLAQVSRMNTALQAIQHMNAVMTVVEKCREAGIARSSSYYTELYFGEYFPSEIIRSNFQCGKNWFMPICISEVG